MVICAPFGHMALHYRFYFNIYNTRSIRKGTLIIPQSFTNHTTCNFGELFVRQRTFGSSILLSVKLLKLKP